MNLDEVVQVDPEKMGRVPCFAGTRVPVKNLFDYLETGDSLKTFLDDFPSVSHQQAQAVIEASRQPQQSLQVEQIRAAKETEAKVLRGYYWALANGASTLTQLSGNDHMLAPARLNLKPSAKARWSLAHSKAVCQAEPDHSPLKPDGIIRLFTEFLTPPVLKALEALNSLQPGSSIQIRSA